MLRLITHGTMACKRKSDRPRRVWVTSLLEEHMWLYGFNDVLRHVNAAGVSTLFLNFSQSMSKPSLGRLNTSAKLLGLTGKTQWEGTKGNGMPSLIYRDVQQNSPQASTHSPN